MSHVATNWAIQQRGLKPATKLVLWHLADRYHPDNGCFPSQDTLAEDCELSRSALNDHLAALEAAGLIRREQRRDERTRRQKSTFYRFAFEPDFGVERAQIQAEPCAESGHGSVSGKCAEPCPENAESRVRNPDTNPVREPVREPVERERASPEDRKRTEAAFERAFRSWPTSIGDSRPAALRAWCGLSGEEREAAAAEIGRYVEATRSVGRKHLCAFAVYLAEKRWEGLPPPPAAEPETVDAPAFGPVWGGIRMRTLLTVPPAEAPAARGFVAQLIAQDDAAGRAERLRRQAVWGWPAVNRMHEAASSGRGVAVVAGSPAEGLGMLMEPVTVGSALFERWRLEHERRGWPWLPDPGRQPVVYLPAGGPERLDDFERALSEGTRDDADRPEAAE